MSLPTVPGSTVRVRYTKWDGSPHWEHDGVYLGRDEHGVWVGMPVGTFTSRPGASFTAVWDCVMLFPDAGWTAMFNAWHPKGTRTYVDLTGTPTWSGGTAVTMPDLDLDVISKVSGSTFIDDEDEFADHRVRFGYPDDLVSRVRRDADALLSRVHGRRDAPFDDATVRAWFDRQAVLDLPVPGLAEASARAGLTLRELAPGDEAAARSAHQELDGRPFLFLHDGETWPAHLDRLARERRGLDLAPGRVPHTFLVAEVGGELVGRVSVRHGLTDGLRVMGGHIGYGVRPGFRGRGYGTALLRAGLAVAGALGVERALVTCDDDNVASARTIERCGGVLESVVLHAGGRGRRYRVPTAG